MLAGELFRVDNITMQRASCLLYSDPAEAYYVGNLQY